MRSLIQRIELRIIGALLLAGALPMTAPSGSWAMSCTDLGGLGTFPCVVNGNDVFSPVTDPPFTGGSHTVGNSGNDSGVGGESNVEAAVNFVTGGFVDLMAVATDLEGPSGDFSFDVLSGSTTPITDLTTVSAFDWVYTGSETLAYLTVKASTSFLIIELAGATSGSANLAGLITNSRGNPRDISHVNFWKEANGVTISVPEPGSVLLLGTGLASLGLWGLRRRKAA